MSQDKVPVPSYTLDLYKKGHFELSKLVTEMLLLLGKICLGGGEVLGKSNRLLSFVTTRTA
jgi:hypothetical protein